MDIFFMQKCFADIRTVQLYFVILPMCVLMVDTHWKNDFYRVVVVNSTALEVFLDRAIVSSTG